MASAGQDCSCTNYLISGVESRCQFDWRVWLRRNEGIEGSNQTVEEKSEKQRPRLDTVEWKDLRQTKRERFLSWKCWRSNLGLCLVFSNLRSLHPAQRSATLMTCRKIEDANEFVQVI
jgi:hypothetical protein